MTRLRFESLQQGNIYFLSALCYNVTMSFENSFPTTPHDEHLPAQPLTPEEQRAFSELAQPLAQDIGNRALFERDYAWTISPRPNPLEPFTPGEIPPGHIANQGDFDQPRQ